MAKSKKSRRARRQEAQKQATKPVVTSPPPTPTAKAVSAAPTRAPAPEQVETAPVNNRKIVNFAQEYFYVYQDMRSVVIIGVLMFVLLVGLSFAI